MSTVTATSLNNYCLMYRKLFNVANVFQIEATRCKLKHYFLLIYPV